jgi:hypothetical protein
LYLLGLVFGRVVELYGLRPEDEDEAQVEAARTLGSHEGVGRVHVNEGVEVNGAVALLVAHHDDRFDLARAAGRQVARTVVVRPEGVELVDALRVVLESVGGGVFYRGERE